MADEEFKKAIKAWHASPYDFEKFGPMRKVSGTGQGAAVYGRGAAYVAESPKVSGPGESQYMLEFSNHQAVGPSRKIWHTSADNQWIPLEDSSFEDSAGPAGMTDDFGYSGPNTAAFNWLADHLSRTENRGDPHRIEKIKSWLRKYDDKAFADWMNADSERDLDGDEESSYQPHHAAMVRKTIDDVEKLFRFGSEDAKGPFSYEVRVHLKPETMLDWDTPVADQHPNISKAVRAAHAAGKGNFRLSIDDFNNGKDWYGQIAANHRSDYDASEALYNAGIHGIRYKDAASRDPDPDLHFRGEKVDLDKLPRDGSSQEATYLKHLSDYLGHPSMIHVPIEQRIRRAAGARLITDKQFADWYEDHKDLLSLKMPKPTYNYVIFHPDFVKAVAQYDIKGNKVKDLGPGVHLKAVDHDPFKEEK